MKLIAIAAASALLMIGTAHAQQARSAAAGAYAEIGYTQFNIDGGGSDVKPGALRGIVGYNVHPNVAVEGMLAFGVKEDDVSVGGVNAEVKLKNALGLYVKPKVNVGEAFEVFGRLGYTRAKVEASVGALSGSGSESGFSYGLGANFAFSPRAYVGIDYMRYLKEDGVKTDGFTVGVGYRF